MQCEDKHFFEKHTSCKLENHLKTTFSIDSLQLNVSENFSSTSVFMFVTHSLEKADFN